MRSAIVKTVFLAVLIAGSALATEAQVVVRVKPARPAVVVAKPAKARAGHVWVAGHWKFNKRTNKYVWVKGRHVRARRGYSYRQGRWVVVNGGHKWVPGTWVRA